MRNMKFNIFDKIRIRSGYLPNKVLKQRIPLQKLDVANKYDYCFQLFDSDREYSNCMTYGNAIYVISKKIMPICILEKTPPFVDCVYKAEEWRCPQYNQIQWYKVIEKLALNGYNYTFVGENHQYPVFLNPSKCRVFDFRCLVKSENDFLSTRPYYCESDSDYSFLGRRIDSYTKPFDINYPIWSSREMINQYWQQFLTDSAKEKVKDLKTLIEVTEAYWDERIKRGQFMKY